MMRIRDYAHEEEIMIKEDEKKRLFVEVAVNVRFFSPERIMTVSGFDGTGVYSDLDEWGGVEGLW